MFFVKHIGLYFKRNIITANVLASATKTYIALILVTLQVFRRFYDTHYVSVFGKNGRMNISHYMAGHCHYPGCALAILCEAPKFANSRMYTYVRFIFIQFLLLY